MQSVRVGRSRWSPQMARTFAYVLRSLGGGFDVRAFQGGRSGPFIKATLGVTLLLNRHGERLEVDLLLLTST